MLADLGDNNHRTITGIDNENLSSLNLPETTTAIRVAGKIGTAGQVLGKHETSNRLEWTYVDKLTIPDNSIGGEKLKNDIDITTTGDIECDSLTANNIDLENDLELDKITIRHVEWKCSR